MNSRIRFLSCALLLATFASCTSKPDSKSQSTKADLRVYAYDSFVGKDSLAVWMTERLAALPNPCRTEIVSAGNGGQLISRLDWDRTAGARVADLVVGLDPSDFARGVTKGLLDPAPVETVADRTDVLRAWEPPAGFADFDFAPHSWMIDTHALTKAGLARPKSLADLASPKWKRKWILQDPRTSAAGLSFLKLTDALHATQAEATWRGLAGNWLTLPAGWSESYALFLRGEAPLVWSYSTSQAYHRVKDPKSGARYQAWIPEEGTWLHLEGSAVVKGARVAAERCINEWFRLQASREFADAVPERQWMFPTRADAKLPRAFSELPKPRRVFFTQEKPYGRLLSDWERWIR